MKPACILLIFIILPISQSQCCTKLVAGSKKCSECPGGLHLFRGSCIIDVENCDTYADGFDCSKCKPGFTLSNGSCMGSSATSTAPSSTLQQIYEDPNTSENLLILADYSRSVQKDLETANVLFGLIRKYPNGTELTVVQFETSSKKYFQAAAEFDKKIPLVFKLMGIKELSTKPVKSSAAETSQTPATPVTPQNPIITPNTVVTPGNAIDNIAIAKLSFKPLNFEERQKDKGFKAVDALQRSVNTDTIGNTPIVLSAYYQAKGLNAEYLIYYESTDKKSIYEGRSIYQIVRDKVFNISFSKTNLR